MSGAQKDKTTMTKKDYIIIAKVIYKHYGNRIDYYSDSENNLALGDLVLELATELAKDNPRFDRSRFLIACGFSS
jgi:hypothetical protein